MFDKFRERIRRMRRSCGTKIRHSSYDDALRRLNGINKRGKIIGLEIYRCKFCNGWHLGHPKKPFISIKITLDHNKDETSTS
jgi:hypothetical protein